MRKQGASGPTGALAVALALAALVAQGCVRGGADESSPGEGNVERHRVATITDSTFPGGALAGADGVFATSDTLFLVVAGSAPRELYLADRTGDVRRRVGVAGAGPGEFMAPVAMLETADEHVVLDARLQRLTFLSKEDLALLRTVQIPALLELAGAHPVLFPDGDLVIAGAVAGEAGAEQPLHVLSPIGDVTRSFGRRDGPGDEAVLIAPAGLAASGDTAVWVADHERYRIALWHREGHLLHEIERDVPWFPWPEPPPAHGERFARLQGVHEDERGRLWVQLSIRARVETEVTLEAESGAGRREATIGVDPDPGSAEAVVEVLDGASGALLGYRRVPAVVGYPVPGRNLQVVHGSSALRGPLIEVWGFALP